MTRCLASVFALFVVTSAPATGQLRIDPCGGAVGTNVRYDIGGGKAGAPFLFLTSTQRGFLPLSLIDPRDTRALGVGIELLGLLFVGQLDASGEATFSLPLPNDTGLVGRALLHQALTVPGQTSLFDAVSEVVVVPFERGGAFRQSATEAREARAFHTILPVADERYLVVGGGSGTLFFPAAWKSTEIFDPATRTFSAGPSLTVERALHTQTRLPDGRYLIAGGVDKANNTLASAEIFDPKTNRFTAVAAMPSPRMGHTASLASDGKVIVTGGLTDMSSATNAVTSALRNIHIYDPATNNWTSGPSMRIPRSTHSAIALGNDRFLLIGGITWRQFFFFRIPSISRTCEIYDYASGRSSSTGSMASARALFGATRLKNGRVLVAGGLTGDITAGGQTFASCELFDATTGRWSATGALGNGRAQPMALTLADERFAVLGGGSGNLFGPLPIKACEAYDEAMGKWVALPDLVTPRLTGAATVLRSCGVLVVGGGTGPQAVTVKTHEVLVR